MIDEYFIDNYDRLLNISKNIQDKNVDWRLQSRKDYDSLVINAYQYVTSRQDKLSDKILDNGLEAILVDYMYKQLIWNYTDFKKEFIYDKDIPFTDIDADLCRDNMYSDSNIDVEDIIDDIEDIIENDLEISKKLGYITANIEAFTQEEHILYKRIFIEGYNNSGKLSRFTGIPRTTCYFMIKNLKEKLRNGYE